MEPSTLPCRARCRAWPPGREFETAPLMPPSIIALKPGRAAANLCVGLAGSAATSGLLPRIIGSLMLPIPHLCVCSKVECSRMHEGPGARGLASAAHDVKPSPLQHHMLRPAFNAQFFHPDALSTEGHAPQNFTSGPPPRRETLAHPAPDPPVIRPRDHHPTPETTPQHSSCPHSEAPQRWSARGLGRWCP